MISGSGGPQTLPPDSSQRKPAPPPPQENYGNLPPVMEPAVAREPASGQSPYSGALASGRPVNQYIGPVASGQPANQYAGPGPSPGRPVNQYDGPGPSPGRPVNQYEGPGPSPGRPVNQYGGPQAAGPAVNHYPLANPVPAAINAGQPAFIPGQPVLSTGQPAYNAGQPALNTGQTVFDARTGASPGFVPGSSPSVPQPVMASRAMVAVAGGQEVIQPRAPPPPAPRPDTRPPVRAEPDVPSFSSGEELKSDHGTALPRLAILSLYSCPILQLVSWPTQ